MRTGTSARSNRSAKDRLTRQDDSEAPTTSPEEHENGERTTAEPPAPPQKKRDPLLAAICHDLRAPLAAVTMGANFVLQTTPDTDESGRSRRVLSAILRSCKQMERLVRDFGDLSEIESDAVELQPSVSDAGAILEQVVETARAAALARHIVVEVKHPAEPLPLRCDHDRLQRALAHVLDNAIRHSPDGGNVLATVDEKGGEVRFAIRDAGPGISEETLAHLYDRSWHAKRADRSGAGLGLAIVRGIVQAHRGRIDIDTKPGQTTFELTLPKEVASADEISETPPH